MWAIIFGFLMPLLPLLVWKSYNREKKVQTSEWVVRYALYTLVMVIITLFVMVLFCDEGTSFMAKMDLSVSFAIKYLFVQIAAVAGIAAAEWYFTTGKLFIRIDRERWETSAVARFVKKVVMPCGIWILAAVVIVLNVMLMFDSAVWGDEAFSANTVRNNLAGIMQILHFWDNHPPLHYLWLKLWVTILGEAGWVYHLSSLIPFIVGIVAAVTLFRKHFGNIPAAFFIVVSGFAAPCVEYNLEIRMYSLAFLGVAMAFYCSYRILCGGRAAWVGMVLWGLVAAYSHYYGLVIAGILIVLTGMAAIFKYKGKIWIKALAALAGYIVGYIPWMGELFYGTGSVSGHWWNDSILPLSEALNMVGAGVAIKDIVLGLFVLFTVVLVLAESALFRKEQKDDQTVITIDKPNMAGWSAKTYFCVVGFFTVAGTLAAGYILCILINPIMVARYLYMLIAVVLLSVAAGSSAVLDLLKKAGAKNAKFAQLYGFGKIILMLILCILIVKGYGTYSTYKATADYEKVMTDDLISVIGDVDEDVKLVTTGVKHLSWTVLPHYFPGIEVLDTTYHNVDADRYWYFSGTPLTSEEIAELQAKGYLVNGYGDRALAKYAFTLYYMEKK